MTIGPNLGFSGCNCREWKEVQFKMQMHRTGHLGAQVLDLVVMLTRVNSSKSVDSSGSLLPHRCNKEEFELDQWFSKRSISQEQSPTGLAKAHIAGRHPQGF